MAPQRSFSAEGRAGQGESMDRREVWYDYSQGVRVSCGPSMQPISN